MHEHTSKRRAVASASHSNTAGSHRAGSHSAACAHIELRTARLLRAFLEAIFFASTVLVCAERGLQRATEALKRSPRLDHLLHSLYLVSILDRVFYTVTRSCRQQLRQHALRWVPGCVPCCVGLLRALYSVWHVNCGFLKPFTLFLTGFRLDTDAWLKEYEKCKDLTQEIVQNIQVCCTPLKH